jgi:uncharacterized protein YjbI with pentapeptide repeats
MPECEHFEICGLDAEENTEEDLCILHSQNPEKNKEEFDEALAAHRKKHEHNFQHFVFPGHVDCFKGATFAEWARFFHATFCQGADFSRTKFSEGADFSRATFTGYAKFFGATFTRNTKFSRATFTRWADFRVARFNDRTSFARATFTEGVSFSDGEFMAHAAFSNAKFMTDASFVGAKFTEGADFSGTSFGNVAEFVRARFLGRTRFLSRQEKVKHIPIFFGTLVNFREVDMAPDSVVFQNADLRKCHFLGTDLRKAEFTSVKWPEIGGRFRVYDEDVELSDGETRPWPLIEQLYRQLKQNHEDRRDYKRAGDFHYGEEEMRRNSPETPRGLWFFLTLYWLVSGYGERCLRPLICAVGVVVLSTFLYLFWGLHPKEGGSALVWTSLCDWPQAAHYSFQVMTLLKPDDLVPVGYAKAVRTFETLAGPILLGLFTWTLKQRLLR